MARLNRNNAAEGISGRVDQFVYKHYAAGTIVGKVPDMSHRKWSERQLKGHDLFREAQQWSQLALLDPEVKKYYQSKVKGRQNAGNVAISEYMRLYKQGRLNEICGGSGTMQTH